LSQIRKYQKYTGLLMAKTPFERLVREIIQDFKADVRLSKGASLLLQKVTEHYMVDLLRKSQLVALASKRVTVQPKDINLVRHTMGLRV
jgi:histone H3